MKRGLSSLVMTLVLVLIFTGCPGTLPEVKLNASALSGAPGDIIHFDASDSDISGVKALQLCQFEVLRGEEVLHTEVSEKAVAEEGFAKFSHTFEQTGTYTVSASVSDSHQQVGTASVTIEIGAAFTNVNSLNIGFAADYQYKSLDFQAVGLNPEGISAYDWKVYNATGYNFTSMEPAFSIPGGLADLGDYTVELTITDPFGNTKSASSTFSIIEPQNPVANVAVIDSAIEFQQVQLNGAESKPDDLQGTLISYDWYIYRDATDIQVAHLSRQSGAPFQFDLSDIPAGDYEVQLVVVNQSNLSAESVKMPLTLTPNIPSVANVQFSLDPLYEGNSCQVVLTADAASAALNKGAIIQIMMDFDDPEVVDLVKDVPVSGALSFDWNPAYSSAVDSVTYAGSFFLKNSGGRWSQAHRFSKVVQNNTPAVSLSVVSSTFFGNTLSIDATATALPSGEALQSVLVTIENATDSADAPVGAGFVNADGSTAVISFPIPAKVTAAERIYLIKCVATSAQDTVTVIKEVTVTDPKVVPNFSLSSESVFTGEAVNLDASGSLPSEGASIIAYNWSVKRIGGSAVTPVPVTPTGTANPAAVLSIDEPGNYEITLEVVDDVVGPCTVPLTKAVTVKSSVPGNVVVTVSDTVDASGNYTFSVTAESPDQSALTYEWFIGEYPPANGVTPDGTGIEFKTKNLTSGKNYVYVVVKNAAGETAVKMIEKTI